MKLTVTNLTKGEFAPELYARFDLPQYNAAAKRMVNFIPQRFGGAAFRPGFRFVGEADDLETPLRYVPFQFSIDSAYVLTLGELDMRLLALGGFVLEEDLKIHSATIESQSVFEIPYHDLGVDDRFYVSGITGMTGLNGRFARVVAVVDADHVQVDIDTTGFAALTGSTGTTRVGAPPAPPPPPPPPPPSPPPPEPPPVGGGGGSGGGLGGGWGGTAIP